MTFPEILKAIRDGKLTKRQVREELKRKNITSCDVENYMEFIYSQLDIKVKSDKKERDISNNLYARLGIRLKTARLKVNMSEEQLGDKLNVQGRTILQREYGNSTFNLNEFTKHCYALGVNPERVLKGLWK